MEYRRIAVLGLLVFAAYARAEAPPAKLVALVGKVEVQRGAAPWEPAAKDMALAEGDHIHTGWKGHATVGFPDGSVVELQPMSLAAIEKTAFTEGGVSRGRILLRLGEVQAQIQKLPGSRGDFQVRTPTTTASVRGTHIQRISYDVGSGTQIRMGDEGLMAVLTPHGRVFVHALQNTGVAVPGDAPPTPARWELLALSTDLLPPGSTAGERTDVLELGVPKPGVDSGSLAVARYTRPPDAETVTPRPQPAPPPAAPINPPVIIPTQPPGSVDITPVKGTNPNLPPGVSTGIGRTITIGR